MDNEVVKNTLKIHTLKMKAKITLKMKANKLYKESLMQLL